MRFVTPVRTINSGPNPNYFNSGRGITWYNFISDQYSGFHGIVILGTLRNSIFLLEGLLEQRSCREGTYGAPMIDCLTGTECSLFLGGSPFGRLIIDAPDVMAHSRLVQL